MLITSIRDYVQLKGRVSLQDIARHFRLPESAVSQMLSFWVNKGIISVMTNETNTVCQSTKCSTCVGCDLLSQPIYNWILPPAS